MIIIYSASRYLSHVCAIKLNFLFDISYAEKNKIMINCACVCTRTLWSVFLYVTHFHCNLQITPVGRSPLNHSNAWDLSLSIWTHITRDGNELKIITGYLTSFYIISSSTAECSKPRHFGFKLVFAFRDRWSPSWLLQFFSGEILIWDLHAAARVQKLDFCTIRSWSS